MMTNQLTIRQIDVVMADQISGKLAEYASAAQGAFSSATERAVKSDTRIFSKWCQSRQVASLPADPRTVVEFIDDQSQTKKPATVRRYCASIAHMHRAAGVADPTKSEIVRLALKRMNRANGTRQRQATGITDRIVAQIEATQPKTLAGLRNVALVHTMRAMLARRSEIAALEFEAITFGSDGDATVLIAKSKTDQAGEGRVLYLPPETVLALQGWLSAAGITSGHVFRGIRKGCRVRSSGMDAGEVSRLLKDMCKAAGIDADSLANVSGHSCRVGMAQDLVADGADLAGIMQAGRWKTAAMPARYAEHGLAAKGAVAQYYKRRRA